jgi:hypothetical protein
MLWVPKMTISSRYPAFLPAVLLLSVVAAACQQGSEAPEQNDVNQAAAPAPVIPRPQPPLDRAGLLTAVIQAASASAAGTEVPEAIASLDGRQFEVRVRFGCRGPAKDIEQSWLGWSYDSEKRTLRVRAKPTISKQDPLVAGIADESFESVEGFWIPRPWLLKATCPAAAALTPRPAESDEEAEPAADSAKGSSTAGAKQLANATEAKGEPVPTAPRVGIAQFFTSQDPRTRRRDSRPYSTVKTLPEGTPVSSQGFNLVLSGRLRSLPGRGVIECVAKGADTPPECVVSAEFLRVWIERPDSREVIAEWGSG